MPKVETDAGCETVPARCRVGVANDLWTGPLFIVGMPRSGTKLLRGLLDQHPRIRILDIETDFFPFLVKWVRQHGPPDSESAFASLFAALSSATYFALRNPDRGPFSWQAWRSCCEGRYDAANLFEAFVRYETDTARDSHFIWGDKSPAHIRHIRPLLEHFPRARIVHIVRDVRDYCVSIRKAWDKDIRRAAFQWGRDVALAYDVCEADPARCMQIRYEDLLRSPNAQMRRLSRFLRIDFSAAMTRLERPVEECGDAAGHREILRDNFRKFSRRLTAREIRTIESLACETMRRVGYQPVHTVQQKQLTALDQRLLRLKDGVRLVVRGARRRGLVRAFRFHLNHARLTNQ